MKTKQKRTSGFNKMLSGALVVAMLFLLIFSNMGITKANQPFVEIDETILYFEQADHVYEIYAELGTALEDLGLPTELSAVISIGEKEIADEPTDAITNEIADGTTDEIADEIADEIIDETTEEIANETAEETTDIAIDENVSENTDETIYENTNETTDEITIEVIDETAGNEDIENIAIANTLAANINLSSKIRKMLIAYEIETIETKIDENTPENRNNSVVILQNIPVIWEGYYNGDENGVYTLASRVDGYDFYGEMPTAVITVGTMGSGTGSISGFFWVDGNGDLDTDWDGLYNGYEWPLAGFRLYLYAEDDLTTALATAMTDPDGMYSFENLEPGNYVLGLWGAPVDGIEYLAPIFRTDENSFAIEWSVSGLPAYTEVIELEDGQTVENINAAMRLPMGIAPLMKHNSLRSVVNYGLKVNDELPIDKRTWTVVRIENSIPTASGPVRAAYLLLKGHSYMNKEFGTSRDYATSALRDRMTQFYTDNNYSVAIPTIRRIAMVPNLGILSSMDATTEPTGQMAGNQTEDILFAPSYRDIYRWVGNTEQINTYHPLGLTPTNGGSFGERFWYRTPAPAPYGTAFMIGYFRSASGSTFDYGLSINGQSNLGDTPGVWVNINAISRNITTHYIDTLGNEIHPPYTDPTVVYLDEAYSLAGKTGVVLPNIGDYEYIEWRRGIDGAPQSITTDPNLAIEDVRDGKDIYLVYNKTTPDLTDVTVSKEVIGEYGSTTKAFTFTVYFTDSSGNPLAENTEFDYIGSSISGVSAPQNDTLTLDGAGKASFLLRHGQMITIQDVPSDVKIKILEKQESKYMIYYTDSKYGGLYEFDPDLAVFDAVGVAPRTFEFQNIYIGGPPVVPTGIGDDAGMIVALSVIAVVSIGSGIAVIEFIKRRTGRSGEAPPAT